MKFYLILLSALIMVTCASSHVAPDSNNFEDLIEAGKDVLIKDRTFERDIDFTQYESTMISEGFSQTRIVSSITFVNCTFNGKVIAHQKHENNTTILTSFQSNLSFINCEFNNKVDFKASSILGRADFTNTAFYKETSFEECTFFQNAYFRGSTYHKELRFQHAVFMQKANFLDAEFDEVASFQKAQFNSEAQFSNAKFMGYADMSNMSCFGNFYANFVEFADRAIFNNSFFYRRVDMNSAKFNRCEMQNCLFIGETRFIDSKVGDHLYLEESRFLSGKPDVSSFDKEKVSIEGVYSGK